MDGDLSDPIWQKAEAITEFYQTDPKEGQPASERTDVRFLYDDNNLYVYVYAYDRNPERIRGTTMNRDGKTAMNMKQHMESKYLGACK